MVFRQKIKSICLILVTLVFLLGQSAYAQKENREIKKIDWKSVTKGERFNEKSEEEKEPEKNEFDQFEDQNGTGEGVEGDWGDSNRTRNRWSGGNPMFDSVWFRYIAIAVLVAVALVILILLLKNRPKNVSLKTDLEEAILNAEEDIDKSDLRYLLKLALEQNNLNAALRIYYLIIIKELNQNNLILYKKDKTNYAYILEMSTKPEYKDFKNLTMAYEYHWYGDKELNEESFNRITPAIEKFIAQVKLKYSSASE